MDIGSRCLAQYSDGKWYECTIISAKPSGTTGARSLKVEFLGYGDRHDVSETDIKPLPSLPRGWSDGVDPESGFPFYVSPRGGSHWYDPNPTPPPT